MRADDHVRSFDIVRKNTVPDSFRLQRLKVDFGVEQSHADEHFHGEIKIPEQWQIGVIVGNSGTGKTTIARELFRDDIITDFEWNDRAVIDNFPAGCDTVEIQKVFYAVGFGSVPCWCKPYHVLSNGEKMRVTLARAILEKDFIVFDEFSSVVDRTVAQTLCLSLNKCLRKYPQKKIILISCHRDILQWLDSDWIFSTDDMSNDFFASTPHGQKSNLKSAAVGLTAGDVIGAITI